MDCLGGLWCNLCIKLSCDVHEAENGHGIRVHKVEPMLREWSWTVTPEGFTVYVNRVHEIFL